MSRTLRKQSDELFFAADGIVQLGWEQMELLKHQAAISPRRRARICAHRNSVDSLHEMLIAISADSYVRPHKHCGKVESFHIIEGTVDVVILNDEGHLVDVIALGDARSGRSFFYRLSDDLYHALLIGSDFLVMHEVTNGPFVEGDSQPAPFAPPEAEHRQCIDYMETLRHQVEQYRRILLQGDRA